MKKEDISMMTKMALCVALLCISSYISIPLPFTAIMITAQPIIINLTALILKPKQSFLVVLVFLIIGAIGVPVFSGGGAGLAKLFGPTGGFLLGFLISAPLMSITKGTENNYIRYLISTICVGMPVIYIFGTAYMCISAKMDIKAALMAAVVPFIIGDIIKCVIGSTLAVALNKVIPYNTSEA